MTSRELRRNNTDPEGQLDGLIVERNSKKAELPSRSSSLPSTSITTNFSEFLEPDFDVKKWINMNLNGKVEHKTPSSLRTRRDSSAPSQSNSAVESNETDETDTTDDLMLRLDDEKSLASVATMALSPDISLEQQATVLVTRLQLLSKDISVKLSQTTNSVMKSMPRVLYDLQLMKEDTANVKKGIEAVKHDLEQVEADTSKALERLKQLDLVKNRMDASRAALREAENWSNLETEASTIFANQDYTKAANRLREARRSLNVFQNTPEYEHRKNLLVRLQNDLEEAVKPQLVTAIQQHDAITCLRFYTIFQQIDHSGQFLKIYFDGSKHELVDLWKEKIFNSSSTTIDIKSFISFLPQFYQEIFAMLNEEYAWCGSIFPNPKQTIQSLIQNIFKSLSPPISACLQDMVDFYKEKSLLHIIKSFTVTESFGLSLEHVFAKPVVTTASEAANGSNTMTPASRRKSFFTMDQHYHLPLFGDGDWSLVLYDPFFQYQRDYPAYERAFLGSFLKELKIDLRSGSMEIARGIGEHVGKVFNAIEAALGRCLTLTHGFAALGFLDTINIILGEFLASHDETLFQLRIECGLISAEKLDALNRTKRNDSTTRASTDTSRSSEDFDFEQDILQQGDWLHFQIGLRLLTNCRSITDKLATLGKKIKNALLATKEFVEESDEEDEPVNVTFNMTHRRESSIKLPADVVGSSSSIVPNTPKAPLSLLRQSSLNSYELKKLLHQLDSSNYNPFQNSAKALDTFTQSCQRFAFDTVHYPISKQFAGLDTLKIWNIDQEEVLKSQRSPFNIEIPQFSLSPSEYITRVGEQLLMLTHHFDVYADHEALGFQLSQLPYTDKSEQENENEQRQESTSRVDETQFVGANEDDNDVKTVPKTSSVSSTLTTDVKNESTATNLASEDITQAWITSLSRGTMQEFLEKILDIPALSSHGISQLSTDIGYLINVLSSLAVEPSKGLVTIQEVLGLEEAEVIQRLREANKISNDDGDFERQRILKKIAAMRGIQLLEF